MALNLLIINQHGENRGDESAFKAMVRSFRKRYACNVTVIGQFRAHGFTFPGNDLRDICYLNMVMSPIQGFLLVWCTFLRWIRFPLFAPRKSTAVRIMNAYLQADLVVSGPGGPYFGDIYRRHEPVHWFFMFLANLHRKPLYLYAPSAGPFSGAMFNYFRRRVYRRIRIVICRETDSASYIAKLDHTVKPVVTADSALQESFFAELNPIQLNSIGYTPPDTKIIAISMLEYGNFDKKQRDLYEQAVKDAINYLHKRGNFRFIFLPQLYGEYHSDVEYMTNLIVGLSSEINAYLLDPKLDSDAHRWLISHSELVIASRYHPQIFAASARVPFIAISYQHKSTAFMRDIGMEKFSISINNVDSESLIKLVEQCLTNSDDIRAILDVGVSAKETLARRTTEFIVDDFERYRCT